MKTASAGVVTARGVRDGDPRALRALCERRGVAVLAYCEELLSGADVSAAAADAFVRFRREVMTAARLDAVNPEALLLRSTRQAALSRAASDSGTRSLKDIMRARRETCALVPDLLAAHAEELLSRADEERLARHLSACSSCHELAERFMSAEHAYRDPPARDVPPELVEKVVAAMAAATPSANGRSTNGPVASVRRPVTPRRTPRVDEPPTVVIPALEMPDAEHESPSVLAQRLMSSDFLLRVLTPALVVAAGVVITLAIGGVFSSSDQKGGPARTPSTPSTLPAPAAPVPTLVAASHAPASSVPDQLAQAAKLARDKRRQEAEAARAARAAKQAKPDATTTTPGLGASAPTVNTNAATRSTPTTPKRYSAQKVRKRTTKRPPSSPSGPSSSSPSPSTPGEGGTQGPTG